MSTITFRSAESRYLLDSSAAKGKEKLMQSPEPNALPTMSKYKSDEPARARSSESAAGLDEHFVPPRDALELQITRIWEKVLASQKIGIRDNFFKIGGGSLQAIDLLASIELAFDRIIPLSVLLLAPTVEQLAGILRSKSQLTPYPTLAPIQTEGSRTPFFFIHPDKRVLGYRNLASYLSPDQPVYELHAQSSPHVKPYYANIEDIAAHYLSEIYSIQRTGPYYLGGFCFAGLIAFEIAQQIFAQGQEVALLALFDTVGPVYPTIAQRIRFHVGKFKALGCKERQVYAISRAKRLMKKIVGRNFEPLNLLSVKPDQRSVDTSDSLEGDSYIILNKNYSPQAYPGRLTLFRSTAQEASHAGKLNGWQGVAAMGIATYTISGTHMNLFDQPNVSVLAEKFRVCLEGCGANAKSRVPLQNLI